MSEKKYNVTKERRQRLVDLRKADVPMWKICKVMELSEAVLRNKYPDVFEEVPVTHGIKPWEPNPEQLRQIELMAGMGIPNKRIALVVGVSPKALQDACGQVIERSSVLMDMRVGANIYKMATGNPDHKNTALMAQFWAKTRMKWQETQRIETTGADGGPIQSQIQIFLPDNGRGSDVAQIEDDGDGHTIDGTVDDYEE